MAQGIAAAQYLPNRHPGICATNIRDPGAVCTEIAALDPRLRGDDERWNWHSLRLDQRVWLPSEVLPQ